MLALWNFCNGEVNENWLTKIKEGVSILVSYFATNFVHIAHQSVMKIYSHFATAWWRSRSFVVDDRKSHDHPRSIRFTLALSLVEPLIYAHSIIRKVNAIRSIRDWVANHFDSSPHKKNVSFHQILCCTDRFLCEMRRYRNRYLVDRSGIWYHLGCRRTLSETDQMRSSI